jgi:hypothetical protein
MLDIPSSIRDIVLTEQFAMAPLINELSDFIFKINK